MIVVGAGPAGATLAYELAQRGIDVAIVEREKLPRYKCCAGGLSVRAAELLNHDMSDIVECEITSASITFAGRIPYYRQEDQVIGYTVMRNKFDYILTKRAENAGAVIFDEHEATGLNIVDGGVQVFTSKGDFTSKLVVGADGAMSTVARTLSFKRKISYGICIETEVIVNEDVRHMWESQITIELGRIMGYAWVFPKSDHLSIGIVCHRSRAKKLKQHYEQFLASLNLGPYSIAQRQGAFIPTCKGEVLAVEGRAILLGDAAGLADPLIGEGIYNAILSANLAAPVIEKALQHGPDKLSEYQNTLEREILPNLKIANFISNVLCGFPSISFEAIRRDERIWRTGCNLLRGKTDYVTIKERLNTLGGIYALLNAK